VFDSAQFVANPIRHGLPQIRLQRALMALLELREMSEGRDQDILHEIVGVGDPTCVSGQASARPPLQPREIPRKQPIQRVGVTSLSTFNQCERGLRIHDSGCVVPDQAGGERRATGSGGHNSPRTRLAGMSAH
jgi:hypothetical protein